jgi:tetratricopeptide (TPR) repeat protein
MRIIGVLVWVAGLFTVAGFALAASNVADSSRTKNRDWGVVSCARVLQSSNETAKNRAVAYFNRAIACKADGDFDRAIADYTEAIRLDPKLAIAYYERGVAYHALGDFDRAIADYTEAIRLDPKLGPKAAAQRAISEKAAAQSGRITSSL